MVHAAADAFCGGKSGHTLECGLHPNTFAPVVRGRATNSIPAILTSGGATSSVVPCTQKAAPRKANVLRLSGTVKL